MPLDELQRSEELWVPSFFGRFVVFLIKQKTRKIHSKKNNTAFYFHLQNNLKIQNSATQANISRETVTSLCCVFYFHATTLLLYLRNKYILKKKTKKKTQKTAPPPIKTQQRFYSWNPIQPQLRKYQVLLLITQTFSKARFISRGLIKIPNWMTQ